jgi:hypothetical protein
MASGAGSTSGAVGQAGRLAPSPAVAARLIAAAAGGLLCYFLWRSLTWPLIHDAALMHYIAWLIAGGAVPYRDTFDMNMPGVYAIHMLALAVGGARDGVWRAFDLAWLAAIAGLAYAYCRPLGDRWAAALPGLLFALHHVGGGASLAGQRDFLECLFLLAGAHGVARACEGGRRRPAQAGAGLALGAAAMVKPTAVIFAAACAAVAAVGARRAGRSPLAAAVVVLGAGLIVPAALVGWLAWHGALGEFLSISLGWTLPFYSQAHGASPLRVLVTLKWGFLAAIALQGAARRYPWPVDARRWLAVAGAASGFLHFALQAKGYDYHLYPLALFLCLLAAPALAALSLARGWTGTGALAAALLVAALVTLGDRGLSRLNQPWEEQRAERVAAVVQDLKKLVGPGETIQVMGPPGGHVLLRLGLRQPTRFFTDFQFFLRADDPRVQALRREFMAALEARPPAAIVVFPGRGGDGPYGRLAEFPAFQRLLDARYRLAIDGNGYRIYARRARA